MLGYVIRPHLHMHKVSPQQQGWRDVCTQHPALASPKPMTGTISSEMQRETQ